MLIISTVGMSQDTLNPYTIESEGIELTMHLDSSQVCEIHGSVIYAYVGESFYMTTNFPNGTIYGSGCQIFIVGDSVYETHTNGNRNITISVLKDNGEFINFRIRIRPIKGSLN